MMRVTLRRCAADFIQGRLHGVHHLYYGSSGTFLPVKEADSHGNSQV
jgi:hypothetical protein